MIGCLRNRRSRCDGGTRLGISFAGQVYTIDSDTAVTTPVGAGAGFTNLNSMARDPLSGEIFSASHNTLVKIDPASGLAAAVANMTFQEAGDVRGMAISPITNELYIVNDILNGTGLGADKLYKVNRITGAGTLIGQTGRIGIQGLEFAADGTLYAWDFATGAHGLCTVNVSSGVATDVNPSATPRNMQSLAFAPDGTLWGVGPSDTFPFPTQLWKINRATGSYTLQASDTVTNRDIRGIAFVPEPGAAALIATAALFGGVIRGRCPRAASSGRMNLHFAARR